MTYSALDITVKSLNMKATKLAHFFDCMSRQIIPYTVNDLDGLSFKDFFGAKGVEDDLKRKGTFLAVYVTDNSLSQDFFIESAKKNLNHPAIYKYPSPYTEDENELMYIIRITDEDDEDDEDDEGEEY